MNEIIRPNFGYLVDVESQEKVHDSINNWIPNTINEYTNTVNIDDLKDKIIEMVKKIDEILKGMSDDSYNDVIKMEKECIKNFKNVMNF